MNKTALEDLHFDTVVTAEYKLKMSAAASGSERGDRPVIFAEGGFDDGAAVTSTATEESAVGLTPLDSGLSQAYDDSTARLPWYERITAPISGGIIEQRHVSIPDDGQAVHTLHYLPPEMSIGRLEVYVMQDGRWIKAYTAEFGSYLTFDVAGTEADIAAVSVISIWWLWGLVALAIVLAAVIVLVSVKKRRAGRSGEAKPPREKAERKRHGKARHEQMEEQKDKRRIKWPIIAVIIVLAALVAAAGVFLAPRVAEKVAPYRAIAALANADELSMEVSVNATLGGDKITAGVPVQVKSSGGKKVTYACVSGVPLYYSDGMLILENGMAYSIGDTSPDYSALLSTITGYFKAAELSGEDGALNLSLDGEQAAALLNTLCPEAMRQSAGISDARIEAALSGTDVESICVTASGTMAGDGAEAYEVTARIDGFAYSAGFDLPFAVAEAAAKGDADGSLEEITDDVLRVLSAWAELRGRDSAAGTLTLGVDCGPVVADTSLELGMRHVDGRRIYSVGKSSLTVYTDGSKAVSRSGLGVALGESELADTAKLPRLAYDVCLKGGISAQQHGEKYVYTAALDGGDMEQLIQIISPDAAKLDVNYSYGALKLTVSGGKLTEIEFDCTGTVKIVLTEKPVTVTARLTDSRKAAPEIPAKAAEALTPETA